ncbi:MAG TPA: tRNA lysidine(34) synthetase TilS [Erysipelothrix sp.]|nr:tRNA lysidine(34) synthetase TilS [Erysipelothrix sp.]
MDKPIIVAVSAGPDSMCLLHKLTQEYQNIVVAHVNYHKRETSMRDEKTVRNYAKECGVLFYKKDFTQTVQHNFQHEARIFRYAFFKELYDKYNASALYLGHHLDDDLETYLMQLSDKRETDYPGIKKETELFDMRVKRPLLKYTKEELVDYCHKHHVPYEIDESNLELEYTRNKIRHDIKRMDQITKDKWLKKLKEAKTQKDKYLASLPILSNPFLIRDYKKIKDTKRLDVLRSFLDKEGAEPYAFSKSYLQEIDRQILGGKAQIELESKTLSVSYGEVMLHGDLAYAYTLPSLSMMQTKHFELRDKGEVIEGITLTEDDFPLEIRSYQAGDKIALRYGTKHLNRFFIDHKIPIHKRKSWPVVENSMKDVVFVVGIGCDIRHFSNNPSVYMVKL